MRNDILERKNDILQWIQENQSKAYICRELKCKPDTLERYLGIMKIEYKGNVGLKGFKRINNNYIPAEQYILNSNVSSSILRDKLIREGIREKKCERCGLSSWLDEEISLELHHIDGNHYNNNFDNLQILCPNCHSLTQNFRNKSNKIIKNYPNTSKLIEEKKENKKTNTCICCGKLITNKATYCEKCYKKTLQVVERPGREIFKQEIRTIPFLQLGAKYGVSNKSIEKWCVAYNLPHKKKDIKNYSDEEWELL